MKKPWLALSFGFLIILILIAFLSYTYSEREKETGYGPAEILTQVVNKPGFIVVSVRPAKTRGYLCIQYTD